MTIGELCNRDTFIVQEGESVVEAAKLMRVFNVGDLVVVTAGPEGNTPVGILTDRDIAVKVVADGADANALKVADVMTPEPVTGKESDTVYDSIERMRIHGIRRLPIVDEKGHLAGIIAVDDLLAFLGEEVNALIALVDREQHG